MNRDCGDCPDDICFSISEISEGPFVIKMHSEPGLEELLDVGVHDIRHFYSFVADKITCGKSIPSIIPPNCSAFTVPAQNGGMYFGRNFDYRECIPAIVFTRPTNGYASCSTADLMKYLGKRESLEDMRLDPRLNASHILPMDGVNEKGVAVCVNAVANGQPISYDSIEGSIYITTMLRLVLDKAATAEEAVELVRNRGTFGMFGLHLFISDKDGDSKVIEYVDGKMIVTESKILTNHYLCQQGKDVPVTHCSSHRFNKLESILGNTGTMTRCEVLKALSAVRQDNPDGLHYTRWSVIYDMAKLDAEIHLRHDGQMDYYGGLRYNPYDVL